MRRYAGFLLLALFIAAGGATGLMRGGSDGEGINETAPAPVAKVAKSDTPASAVPVGSGFDFYVLSLSWSPTFCAGPSGGNSGQQCGPGKSFGFIVHGLWPQYEKGYPESCSTAETGRIPDGLVRELAPIMPSAGLMRHEWEKHGTCSGLSREDYFDVLKTARGKIAVPKSLERPRQRQTLAVNEIERQMIAANPGLKPQGVAVTCERGQLDEIRICLTKDLEFRTCPEVDRQSCRAGQITVPPVR
ncbi:ribonuclease T2 family protein [Rhizobium sp. NRK18]|uniref:ribonuclease T2 family protein n=1 Tax=Rhizobium sp. NRK18 TaxID=2964667 RepID=UPI0021C44F35|nr:ribonuclease T(2) [Rhizobium sp. NRK18]MCQ2004684.1 ribonuclease T(2) [Rhizobium sp. NRK18]